MAGKVVLITGASSGIGEQIAYEYARRGACLALAARRENRLHQVAEKASAFGSPDVLVISADVSKVDHCQRMVDTTINHFGRVDHLVNNAGVSLYAMFQDCSDITAIKSIMEINYWGSVFTSKFAIPHLRKSRGKIIVIASSAHWSPTPRLSLYSATKAAMVSFFEILRVELEPAIKITIVAPGIIESEMTQGKLLSKDGETKVDEKMKDFLIRSKIPILKTEEFAKAVVKSACRGDRYLIQPLWWKPLYYFKLFCPEILEHIYRVVTIENCFNIID
ncbi:hypothetical protein Ancab_007554 [Ancistrocladus abbreviatus]